MFAAVLTTLCWSIAALFSQRSIRVLGVGQANLGRLIVAVILLGAYAHFFGLGTVVWARRARRRSRSQIKIKYPAVIASPPLIRW